MIVVTLAIITLLFILITLLLWVFRKPFLTLISLGITIGFMLSTYIVDMKMDNGPAAIDVYKGKTTLQYKVIDGIKVDSCVIWKNK